MDDAELAVAGTDEASVEVMDVVVGSAEAETVSEEAFDAIAGGFDEIVAEGAGNTFSQETFLGSKGYSPQHLKAWEQRALSAVLL